MIKIKTCITHAVEYIKRCPLCQKEYEAAYKLAHKEAVKAYAKEYYAKTTLAARIKRRQIERGMPGLDANAPAHALISSEQKETPESSLKKKRCAKCKVPKLLDEFSNRKHTKDGLEFRCKTCRNGENMARIERERIEGPRSDLLRGPNVITHRMEDSPHRHGSNKPAACAMSPLEWA